MRTLVEAASRRLYGTDGYALKRRASRRRVERRDPVKQEAERFAVEDDDAVKQVDGTLSWSVAGTGLPVESDPATKRKRREQLTTPLAWRRHAMMRLWKTSLWRATPC